MTAVVDEMMFGDLPYMSMVPCLTARQRELFRLLRELELAPEMAGMAGRLNDAIGQVVCEAEKQVIRELGRRMRTQVDDLLVHGMEPAAEGEVAS